MHNHIRVADNPNLVRDSDTNAILDVDADNYKSYVAVKQQKMQQLMKISQLEERINNQEASLNEIKDLLHKLLER